MLYAIISRILYHYSTKTNIIMRLQSFKEIMEHLEKIKYKDPSNDREHDYNQAIDTVSTSLEETYRVNLEVGHRLSKRARESSMNYLVTIKLREPFVYDDDVLMEQNRDRKLEWYDSLTLFEIKHIAEELTKKHWIRNAGESVRKELERIISEFDD